MPHLVKKDQFSLLFVCQHIIINPAIDTLGVLLNYIFIITPNSSLAVFTFGPSQHSPNLLRVCSKLVGAVISQILLEADVNLSFRSIL